MKKVLESYLFSQHFLVGDADKNYPDSFETIFSLANMFGIRILKGQGMACRRMIHVASSELGTEIPKSFYQYFPKSVRNMTPDQLLFDQLRQYFISYGLGLDSVIGHPFLEQRFAQIAFRENIDIKDFEIITLQEAEEKLLEDVNSFLSSSRPLRKDLYNVVLAYITSHDYMPQKCSCKDTAINLAIDTGDIRFTDFIALPDLIRMAEILQTRIYAASKPDPEVINIAYLFQPFRHTSRTIRDYSRFHLRRRDKSLIARTLNRKLSKEEPDISSCCEKRQRWHGLLSDIHYAPKTERAKRFIQAIWAGENLSVYSRMEAALKEGNVSEAASVLIREKGVGALLRNFRFLLSRCKKLEDADFICDNLTTNNLILLIQLLMTYDDYVQSRYINREFRFMRMNKLCIHRETEQELERRKSFLPGYLINDMPFILRRHLERNCAGHLGKVYLSPYVVDIPLPLQEASASGGYGSMPKGTVFHLNRRQITRAFIYWEGTRDINLAGTALSSDGLRVDTFNWQTMFRKQSKAIAYSGDQTSGAGGGTEYFDIDTQNFKGMFSQVRYLVMEANVYNAYDECVTFQDCVCRAGFMQRDRAVSGDMFDPRTVKTNFWITGESTQMYLFAIDVKNSNLIWLNLQPESSANTPYASHEFLLPYLKSQQTMNIYDFFCILSTELTDDPMEADIIVSDENVECRDDAEVIRSYDSAKILSLLNNCK